eukprot:PhF_6_TR13436/c0_g2_i1/m.21451
MLFLFLACVMVNIDRNQGRCTGCTGGYSCEIPKVDYSKFPPSTSYTEKCCPPSTTCDFVVAKLCDICCTNVCLTKPGANSLQDGLSKNGCKCDCKTGFMGNLCDVCDTGYINYPECTKCDVNDCNGKGISITSNSDKTECVCTCQPQYAGSKCDKCSKNYFGFPDCLPCTTNDYCNGRATTANVNGDKCDCTCEPQYAGSRCETCNVNQVNASICNGRAAKVTMGAGGSCDC